LLTRATTVSTVLNTSVQSVIGVEKAWETAAQALAQGFESQLAIQFESGILSPSEEKRAAELVNEKYTHPSWTERS
jgi:lipoate-protein ligase A